LAVMVDWVVEELNTWANRAPSTSPSCAGGRSGARHRPARWA